MKKLNYLFLVLFLLAFSCKSDDDTVPPVTPEPEPDFVVETIIPNGDENYLNNNSDYIFDQEKLHTFEINLPGASLAAIDADPSAEQYVEASLTFEGETISPVGLRYKGSIGAFVDCLSGNNWANPSGRKTCTKLSMKIKINWNDSDTKFFGLKKLQLHSQNNDPTQMRERLGYWLYRSMDVPAPRSIHARLVINGVYIGLFALTEQIDGRFARYNFDDGKGNLYKEIWPLKDNGQAFSEQVFLDHLKTNEDEDPTAVQMRTFAQEIANADPDDLQNVISNWMDVDQTLSYVVVDRMIRNDDGAFHWYCFGAECSPHNFYWYEEPSAGTVHLIPWDLDHAFENIISNVNAVTPIADDWGETRNNCLPFSFGALGVRQRSAACDKLTEGWASFTDEYEILKNEFIEGPFSASEVNILLDTWEDQIREATTEASEKYGDAISVNEWENALQQLRAQVDYAREN